MKTGVNHFFFLFVMVIAFTISVKSSFAASWVDLEVDSIKLQPRRAESKTPVVIVPIIRNSGSEEADNFYLALSLKKDGKLIKKIPNVPVISSLPRLGSGISVPVELGLLAVGDYEVDVEVDAGNFIRERNEKNNQKSLSFHVWEPSFNSVTYGYN